jgi:hypothetical protein
MYRLFTRKKAADPTEWRLSRREFSELVGTSLDATTQLAQLVRRSKHGDGPFSFDDVNQLLDGLSAVASYCLERNRQAQAVGSETGYISFNQAQHQRLIAPNTTMLQVPEAVHALAAYFFERDAKNATLLYQLLVAEIDVAVKRWLMYASINLPTEKFESQADPPEPPST